MSLPDLNRDPEKAVDLNSSRKSSRQRNWTKEESIALYEVLEGLSADKCGLQKEAMWEIVSGRMGNTKNSTECKVFHENTLEKYRYRHRSASSVVPYTQLKEFVQQEFASIEPSPSESVISVTFKDSIKKIDIDACSEVVAAATIRSIFDLEDTQIFWLVNESGAFYGIDRKIPSGNYTLQLAKSVRAISVSFKGCRKSFDINSSSEIIAAAIRSVFGLEDAERFWLENEWGDVYGAYRNMRRGNYRLHLVKDQQTGISPPGPNHS